MTTPKEATRAPPETVIRAKKQEPRTKKQKILQPGSWLFILESFYLRGMKVYGIPNCDTVKKTLDWFKANKINYEFHDFKKLGIAPEKLREWNNKAGYEAFLNKKSTTWKDLTPELKENIKSAADALPLLEQKTSMIKRPVIEDGNFLCFGFDESVYSKHFLK